MIETPYYKQKTNHTCGPVSLQIVLGFYGDKVTQRVLADLSKTTKEDGCDHKPLLDAARKRGLYCWEQRNATVHLIKHFIELDMPVLVNYVEPKDNEAHYSVVVGFTEDEIVMNDPYFKKGFTMKIADFERRWMDGKETPHMKRWIAVVAPHAIPLGRHYRPVAKTKKGKKT